MHTISGGAFIFPVCPVRTRSAMATGWSCAKWRYLQFSPKLQNPRLRNGQQMRTSPGAARLGDCNCGGREVGFGSLGAMQTCSECLLFCVCSARVRGRACTWSAPSTANSERARFEASSICSSRSRFAPAAPGCIIILAAFRASQASQNCKTSQQSGQDAHFLSRSRMWDP